VTASRVDRDLPLRILVEGRPGSGKSTVARRLVDLLRRSGAPVAGFFTEEIREGGRRLGFSVQDVNGNRGVLAHVDIPGPPRVSKYGVDLQAFETVAIPALQSVPERAVVVIDELGKMELASARFRETVADLLDRRLAVVATIHVYRHPFTDALKRRPGVEVIRVAQGNRDELPDLLARRLNPARADDDFGAKARRPG
jgi:nucleoside-triphosphatase